MNLDNDLDQAELEKVSNFLNANFKDMAFPEISDSLKSIIGRYDMEGMRDLVEIAGPALELVDAVIEENIGHDIRLYRCGEQATFITNINDVTPKQKKEWGLKTGSLFSDSLSYCHK